MHSLGILSEIKLWMLANIAETLHEHFIPEDAR